MRRMHKISPRIISSFCLPINKQTLLYSNEMTLNVHWQASFMNMRRFGCAPRGARLSLLNPRDASRSVMTVDVKPENGVEGDTEIRMINAKNLNNTYGPKRFCSLTMESCFMICASRGFRVHIRSIRKYAFGVTCPTELSDR